MTKTKTRATATMLVEARMRGMTPATKMSKVVVPRQAAADVAAAQTVAGGLDAEPRRGERLAGGR
jgi:hypothetical protein